jgi:hypothetical protein
MRPHLFVTRGSLLNFACDAWLLPTDRALQIEPVWRGLPRLHDRVAEVRNESFTNGEEVSLPLLPLDDAPTPILTAVPDRGIHDADDDLGYAEVARRLRHFVEIGAAVARKHPRTKRPLPLLAVPLFSSAGGGSSRVRDALVIQQIRVLQGAATEFEVDIAFIAWHDDVHAFAQSRRRLAVASSWPDFDERTLADVKSLAGLAQQRRLVPFLGAGTSVSAGGPSWSELLDKLGRNVGLNGETSNALKAKNVLDQASYLSSLYEEEGSFARAVVAEISTLERYGLAPALLTAIDSEQAITLNYDTLFENASRDADVPRAVIPGEHEGEHDRWLLKLHGTVEDAKTIVLTRDDYLGFDASRRALSSIVQATLATRHILFVGFGLSDDHFHEIVHDVRLAFPLTLFADPLDDQLWKGRLNLVSMVRGPFDESRVGEAARLLEIFLDALAAFATDAHTYLLAEGHESALTPAELQLRERLSRLLQEATDEERATGAWQEVATMSERLGHALRSR